jgi:hypothetical protein
LHVSRGGALVTLITAFETERRQQHEPIDSRIRFVETLKDEPGLIATALHRSKDGARAINYAQWRSMEI